MVAGVKDFKNRPNKEFFVGSTALRFLGLFVGVPLLGGVAKYKIINICLFASLSLSSLPHHHLIPPFLLLALRYIRMAESAIAVSTSINRSRIGISTAIFSNASCPNLEMSGRRSILWSIKKNREKNGEREKRRTKREVRRRNEKDTVEVPLLRPQLASHLE